MGEKERLQKLLDLLLEKIKFWRYVFLAIFSSLVGMLFGLSQNKIILNGMLYFLGTLGIIGVILSLKRLSDLYRLYDRKLQELEETED